MTVPRAAGATAAVVVAVVFVYGLTVGDWSGGVLVGLLLALVGWTLLRAVQAADGREHRLAQDAEVAELTRLVRDVRQAATTAAAERASTVADLGRRLADHVADDAVHRPRPVVPGQRRDEQKESR